MRGALVPAAGGVIAWCTPALAPLSPSLARALRVPLTVEGPGVLLTFDDGPHPEGTPAVLDALEAASAKALFFLVGEQVARRPSLARRIAAAGHGVAVHCHRHRNQLRLTPRQVGDDVQRATAAIADATGTAPALYRPPYGIFSAGGLAEVRRRGLRPLLWSRWGRDWARGATAEGITRLATRELGPGDVVLLHDADYYSARGSWRRTAAAVPLVLAEIARQELATADSAWSCTHS